MSFLEKGECGYVLPYMGMLMEVAGTDFHNITGESLGHFHSRLNFSPELLLLQVSTSGFQQ